MGVEILPAEVLGEIFYDGLEQYDPVLDPWADRCYIPRQEFLSIICLVCRYWNELAYSTPSLWSLVAVHQSPHLSSRIRAQLLRAKHNHLNIVFYRLPGLEETDEGTLSLWEEVKATASRWRTLALGGPAEGVGETYMKEVFVSHLPELQDTTFAGFHLSGIPKNSFLISAPRLRRYSQEYPRTTQYEDLAFIPFIPTPSVQAIRLRAWNGHMLDILSQFHGLQTLVLQTPPTEVGVVPVDIPSLQNLELRDCGSYRTLDILTHLTANNLKSISLTGLRFVPNFLPDPTPTLFPSLSRLHAQECSVTLLESFIRSLKHAEAVTLEFDLKSFTLRRNTTQNHFASQDLPLRRIESLCSLKWVGTEDIRDGYFASWAEARATFGEVA